MSRIDHIIVKSSPTDEGSVAYLHDNEAVSFAEAQTLTDAQKTQVRENIGAGSAQDVSDLKSQTENLSGGTTGQVLRKKTNTDYDVEWSNVGAPTDEQVTGAVDTWLEEHPEATTTVQDGSITETKLESSLVPYLKNNYVTPEMFGAKGDGTTDDSAAISAMFASNNNVFVFGNKTYLVDSGIDVMKSCVIHFDHTILLAKKNYGLWNSEYVIAFKAYRIKTFGRLNVKANLTANIGIWLAEVGGSWFDELNVENARLWGIYCDIETDNNNSLNFNYLGASQCGAKAHAKAKYLSSSSLEITDISGWFTSYGSEIVPGILSNTYHQARMVIDDSLYTRDYVFNRVIYYHSGETDAFTLDKEDLSKAVFTITGGGLNVLSDYKDDDNGRNVLIPIGGGIHIQSQHSEGGFHFQRIVTQSNPTGVYLAQGYGGNIDVLMSEYDTIVMQNDCLHTDINYTYTEGIGTGYESLFGNGYDRITQFSVNANAHTVVHNPFIGSGRVPYMQGNIVVNNFQGMGSAQIMNQLSCPDYLASNKLYGLNAAVGTSFSMDVNEYYPQNTTIDALGFTAGYVIRLNLADKSASYKGNAFDPKTLYIRRRRNDSSYDDFTITLHSELINEGYTIIGAESNVLTLHPSDYGNLMKITIILLSYSKEFYVMAEPMTIGDDVGDLKTQVSGIETILASI